MSQSLVEADNLQDDPPIEIDYDDLVVSYMKDKSISNLITQRLYMSNELKKEEENKLKSIKEAFRESGTNKDLIKSSVSENCMLVHGWTKYSSENSEIETKIKLFKQLEAEEIKLYEEQIEYLEELNNKYVSMKDTLQPIKLEEILNDLRKEKQTIEKKISEANGKLSKLDKVEPKSYNRMDLGVIFKQLEEELPALNERIKLLDKQNVIDQESNNILKEEMAIYEQEN